MNTLLIEKQTGGYFKFTLNGDTANAITSINNDLLAVGNQLHFKTGNGANIVKEQFIYPADVTIVSGGTFTFTTVAQVWDKLIAIDYFAWLGSGSTGGVDRFDDLLDTFSYTGNAGKAVVVDNSELKLVPITLYNKRLFTELEDTPSSLVPDKMVVVNPAGTALIFQDQPEPPAEYLNSVGYFDYNDLATQTTPLNAVANVALKLTNDTEGANTSTDQNPYGVSYVWDYTTNQFNFSELEVGDTIDVRVHVQVTTTTSNQKISLKAKFGIGSVSQFENAIYENQFKSSGTHEVSFVAPFYMGSSYITDYPAELYLTTDASATVKVDGWYVRILRKNINIITVDYQVEDATTTTKGIVRLAGDLSGTANNPTVPELANKVPTSRTVSTTSPLLGGGALSSNLSLSIQQSNSVDSGYLSNVDWITFNGKANDNAVVKLTGDQSIAGNKTFTTEVRTIFQNGDAAQITFKNTGDLTKTLNIGHGSNGNIFSSTGLDFRVGGLTSSALLILANENAIFKENLTAKSFIKSGGTSSQFLKADGSIDSTAYLPLTGGTLTGSLFGTDGTFAQSYSANTLYGYNGKIGGTGISGGAANGLAGYFANNSTTYPVTRIVGLSNTNLIEGLNTSGTATFTVSSAGIVTGSSFVKSGGTSSQFLKADGSVDSNTYALTSQLHDAVTIGTTGILNGLSLSGQVLSLATASSTTRGALTAEDYNYFFAKQNALTNPVTGTGTSGQVAFWDGTSSITGESNLFWDATNDRLGIGTTSPSSILHLNSSSDLWLRVQRGSNFLNAGMDGTGAFYNTNTNHTFYTQNGVVNAMHITSGGNVGIGTTSPASKLQVFSDRYNDSLTFNAAAGFIIGGSIRQLSINTDDTSPYGIGFQGKTNGNTAANIYFQSLGGNVLIGTTTDAGYKLDVNGSGRFSGDVTSTGVVSAAGTGGFASSTYAAGVRNPIWRFGNADGYGLSYFQGTAGEGGNDTIGLHFGTATSAGSQFKFLGNGNCLISGSVTASGGFFNSDIRLKDLTDYDYNVSDIKPITYLWKDGRDNKRHVGYSAQQVQKVMPDAVNEDEKGFLSVNYVEVLVAKISQMEKEIAYLKSKI